MSSAALQSAPHQPATVGTYSPVAASSSNRPYTAGSSQSRDPNYNQTTNASPSSTRRPSRRPSGNGASANNNNPQQSQYYSPSGSGQSSAVTPRGTPSNHASPTATAAPSGYPVMAPGDHQRGVPPIVSPRTSSNRNAAHAAASAADRSSRRTGYTESANSPRAIDGQTDRAERQRSNGNTQVNGVDRGGDDAVAAATAAARARRRAADSPREVQNRPSGSREPRAANSTSNSQPRQTASRPGDLSREASEVLSRVVISKPEVDIERERERMAEAVPSPISNSQSPGPMGSLSVVPSEGVEDGGRGARSRHDHAASSGKREKNMKFGEYYLGNTLGEGEFGKVKMGWKQEGGVQVSWYAAVNEIN
jgi:protein-serine/threonine kinase